MKKDIYIFLAVILIANAFAPLSSQLGGDVNASDTFGDKIIICTGWGIEYVSISELFGGDSEGENENNKIPLGSKNHCPLCLNPSVDANSLISSGFAAFLNISLTEKIHFSLVEEESDYRSNYQSYLVKTGPPTFS